MLSVRLSPELEQRLNTLAQETHRSKSFYIAKALEEFLDDQEDYLLATQTLERVKAGQEKTYSLSELAQELNLDE
jgi:RHH-type rel operon transcriptional repressor/antitoxin RelB